MHLHISNQCSHDLCSGASVSTSVCWLCRLYCCIAQWSRKCMILLLADMIWCSHRCCMTDAYEWQHRHHNSTIKPCAKSYVSCKSKSACKHLAGNGLCMSNCLHVWHPVRSISQQLTVPHTRPTLLCQWVLRWKHLQGTSINTCDYKHSSNCNS